MEKKTPKNPFVLAGFQGGEYFCDRREELEMLDNHIKNDRNVVLFSWRRMGKTALIHYYLNIQSKKTEPLYVDLLPTRSISEAVKQITQKVMDRYGRTESGLSARLRQLVGKIGLEMTFDSITGLPSVSVGLSPLSLPEKSLTAIGEFLTSQKKTIIIALDEFQQIGRYETGNGEALFRDWMQSFPSIRFIFSGSHRGMMTAMFTETKRPFYRSCQLMALDAIALDEYIPFIKANMQKASKKMDTPTIRSIYEWSRSQTYCIQLICNRLYGSALPAQIKNLDEIYGNILLQEQVYFSQFTNLLTRNQYELLSAIAKDEPAEKPLSQHFRKKHNLSSPSSVQRALEMLIHNEIIVQENDTFLVHDVLLARWLQRI